MPPNVLEAAAAQGIDLGEWVARAIQNKLAEERIQIVLPPAMRDFVSELLEACGLEFEDFVEDCSNCIWSEISETFKERPYAAGILDHVEANYGPEVARGPEVLAVIEKHRGKFPLAAD